MGKRKAPPEPPAQILIDPNLLPPRPDRSVTDSFKKAFRLLQIKHGDLQADRMTLEHDLRLAEAKEKKLQSECDLILDQLLARESPNGQIPPFDLENDLPLSDTEETEPQIALNRQKRPREIEPDILDTNDKRQRLD